MNGDKWISTWYVTPLAQKQSTRANRDPELEELHCKRPNAFNIIFKDNRHASSW